MSRTKRNLKENLFRLREKLFLLDAPKSVQWIATQGCNFRCIHCMVDAGKPLSDELSTDEILSVVSDMVKMRVKSFAVTGGEPLVRKDVFEVMRYAKENGMKISLATNGSLVFKYKNELEELGLDSVMVSVDGPKDVHTKIRGKETSYDEAVGALSYFKGIGVPVRSLSTTVCTLNVDLLEDMKDIVRKSGANYWSINILMPEGRAKQSEGLFLSTAQMRKLLEFVAENREGYTIGFCSEAGYLGNEWGKKVRGTNKFFCSCGWDACAIMANGDVMACPIFEDSKHVAGNVRKKTFEEIWNEGFDSFRNRETSEMCQTCSHLSKCGGGCKVMREINAACYKGAWEN